jgi:multiple sugar transport system permease protein
MANRDRLWGIVYVLPALALVLAFIAYPLASVVYHAFTEWDGIEPPQWIGFENFSNLIDDPVFRTSLRNNALFALSVPIQVVVPMVLAWLIHERIPGWRFFRSTFFLPAVISTVVVGLVAQVVFRLDGPLNSLLGTVGLESAQQDWLGKAETSIPAVLLVLVWANFGYNTLIYLAGMSALDPSLTEAARMDGARPARVLFSIVAPNLKRVMELVLVTSTVTAFAFMFAYIFVITNGAPGFDTYVTEFMIYKEAFALGNSGYADSGVHRGLADPHSHPWRRGMSRREGWRRAPVVAGMALISASALFPLYFMASNAFRSNADYDDSKVGLPSVFSFDTLQRAWEGASIPTYMRNSLVVVAGTVVLSIIVASMAGYSFSKLRWRPRSALYLFVLAWIAVPPLILLVPLYVEMVNLDLYDTPWSLILIYSAVNLPFNTYLMTAYFRGVPDDLVDAARLDGASAHGVFLRVMLPLARPALATLVIFNFLWAWNEFIFALLLLPSEETKTLTVGVLQLQGRFNLDPTALMAGLFISTLPVIGVYLIFQRHLVRAVAAGIGR